MKNNKAIKSVQIASLITLFFWGYPLSYANTLFEGCGPSKEEANSRLAQSLSTNVKSVFEKKVNESSNPFFDFFSRSTKSVNIQKTDAYICGQTIIESDGKICSIITAAKSVPCAKNKLQSQLEEYQIGKLPKDEQLKLKKAKEWLAAINSTKPLYAGLGYDKFSKRDLNKLTSIENQLLGVFNQQFVRFNIKGDKVRITLDGNKNIIPNKTFTLKTGSHSFVIESPDSCKIVEDFNLTNKQDKVLEYDLTDYKYPVLTFHTNLSNVSVAVDGKRANIGETKTFKRCDGEIAYLFTYGRKVKEGTVRLRPGLNRTIKESFPPPEIIKTAQAYKKGNFWQVQFENITPTAKSNGIDKLSGLRVGKMTHNNYYRYGYQFIGAVDDKDSYAIEANYTFKLQLTDYDNGTDVLFLGPFVFIPQVGIEAGLAYHNLDGKETFESKGDGDWKKFYKSFIVLRPTIGLDVTFNSDFALSVNYGRSLLMNKSNIFSTGLLFRWK